MRPKRLLAFAIPAGVVQPLVGWIQLCGLARLRPNKASTARKYTLHFHPQISSEPRLKPVCAAARSTQSLMTAQSQLPTPPAD